MPMAGVIENSQILILQKSILQIQAEQRSLKVTVDLLLSESKHPIQRANQVPPINSEVTKLKARLNLLEKKLATSETTSKRKMVALESRIVNRCRRKALTISWETFRRVAEAHQSAETTNTRPQPQQN